MGEKKKEKEDEEKKDAAEKKKKEGSITVVLKADLHCEGCASKVVRCIRSFHGVETVAIGDGERITVLGEVDPVELQERLEKKTHKKVELISPQAKKNGGENKEKNDNNSEKKNDAGKEKSKKNKKKKKKKNSTAGEEKTEENKSTEKEPPVTTAVLKVSLHCDGCIQKIHRTVTKTKGFHDLKIDKQKELVTVTGAMDMNALAESLTKHVKRQVQIVPPPNKKEQKGGGGEGDPPKNSEKTDRIEEKSAEGIKPQTTPVGYPYPFAGGFVVGDHQFLHYNANPYSLHYHAPQLFSDENPNSCSVM